MNRSISSPLASGITAALIAFVINLAIPVVPAIAAHTAAQHTTISVLDAITTALDFSALGHLGSIELTIPGMSGPVTLAPLGLTLVFGVVCTLVMRKRASTIHVTARDGSLLPGAITALGALAGGFVITYGILTGLISLLANTSYVHVTTAPTTAGAVLIAALSAGLGIMLSLRRPARGDVPAVGVLALIPPPTDAILRATAAAFAALTAAGTLVFTGLLLAAGPDVIALTRELQPGLVGGIVLILAQLFLLPTFVVWTLAPLLGGTVAIGVGTGISLGSAQTSVLPAVPMLAAVPGPGEFHGAWWLLLILPIAAVTLGGVVLGREKRDVTGRRALALWAGYAALMTVCLLILCSIATGQIGTDQLAELGPRIVGMILPVLGICVLGTGLAAVWFHTTLGTMVGERITALRERVDADEQAESTAAPTTTTVGEGTVTTRSPRAGDDANADSSDAEENGDATELSEAERAEQQARAAALERLAEQKRAANAPLRVRTASERREDEPVSRPVPAKRPRAIRPPAKARGRYRVDPKRDR